MRNIERSRANRETPGEDQMFRGVEDPIESLAWRFHGRILRSPRGFERGVDEGWQRSCDRTLGGWLVRRVYIPPQCLSVVPTGDQYYRVSKEIQLESSYWYYRRSVGSTEGPIGSTDGAPVLPLICRTPTISSYRYFRPRVDSTVIFSKFQQWRLAGTSDLVSVVLWIFRILKIGLEEQQQWMERNNYGHVEQP
jgi:hypothetical protein